MKKFTIKHYAFSLALSLLAMGHVSAEPWNAVLVKEYKNNHNQQYPKNETQLKELADSYLKQIAQIGKDIAEKIKTAPLSIADTLKNSPKADQFYNITISMYKEAGSKSIMTVVEALKGLPANPALAKTLKQAANDFLTIFTENPASDIPAVKEFLAAVEKLSKGEPKTVKQKEIITTDKVTTIQQPTTISNKIEEQKQNAQEPATVTNPKTVEKIDQKEAAVGSVNLDLSKELSDMVKKHYEAILETRKKETLKAFFANPIKGKEAAKIMVEILAPLAELKNTISTDETLMKNGYSEEALKKHFENAIDKVIANIEEAAKIVDFINMKDKQKNTFKQIISKNVSACIDALLKEPNIGNIGSIMQAAIDPLVKLDKKLTELVKEKTTVITVEQEENIIVDATAEKAVAGKEVKAIEKMSYWAEIAAGTGVLYAIQYALYTLLQ